MTRRPGTKPPSQIRLTQFAAGGGCSCKVAAADLELLLAEVFGPLKEARTVHARGRAAGHAGSYEVMCGLESGDDATIVRIAERTALVTTTDFFPPVVDDAFDWGRIAAANALSDVYAMGGEPLSALNLLSWPADRLPYELAAEVLRGGLTVAEEAACILAGGHSIVDETPKYGLAVTGLADPARLLRNDAGRVGDPISLTKPIGLGILNNRHKVTGEQFPEAVETMVTLNRDASRAALSAGIVAATDVTGFGLLGHLFKMARASGVSAIVDAAAVPVLAGARESLADGYIPGGSKRNLSWVAQSLQTSLAEEDLLLLADAQTSGGLLVGGVLKDATVIGEFVEFGGATLFVR